MFDFFNFLGYRRLGQLQNPVVHHSLEVPGLHGRGGIYFDDHMQAISNTSGNVMYKAAGRAFLVNGGAGNNITRNLIVNGGIGIYNQHYDDMTRDLPLYDNGTLKRGDKGDAPPGRGKKQTKRKAST